MERRPRESRHLLRCTALAAGAALLASGALAQPVRITPADPPPVVAPATPPSTQTNTQPTGAPLAPEVAPAQAPKAPDFVIQPLRAPDPSSTGLLDDANGGLGITMWQGSTRAQAQQALGVLPAPVASPALRILQERLLLTAAEVPPGSAAAAVPSILGQRVAQLVRLGRMAEAEKLGVPRPRELNDPVFHQLPFDLALLRSDLPKGCEIAAAALREDPAAMWQKAAVLCRYTAKDLAGGDLALSLWRDGGGDDPAFNALAAALRGDARAKVETLGGATPLHFAMLRAAGRPLPKDTLDQAAPALLAALAGYDKADPEARLTAAERAVRGGALPNDFLAEVYGAVEIPDAQRMAFAAAVMAGKDKSGRAAAFLYQSARAGHDPKMRGDILRRAVDVAVARGLLLPTAAIYRPILADMAPNEENISAAGAAIRVALGAGDTGLAGLWFYLLQALPPEKDKAGETVAAAWPLLLIAGEAGEWRDSRFDAWLATQDDMPVADRNARAALLLALAEGAGIAVPAERWDGLLDGGTPAQTGPVRAAPPVAVWRTLLRALDRKAKAETVALALALLGPDGASAADGQSLATALGALRGVGLAADSRRIALEAALMRGF